jgi:hypothetical protein
MRSVRFAGAGGSASNFGIQTKGMSGVLPASRTPDITYFSYFRIPVIQA